MGLDIIGLVKPLVDLGFELGGNAKTDVQITIGAGARWDAATETDLTDQGGATFTVPAFRGRRREDQLSDVTAKDEHLSINTTDLEKAAAAAGVPVPDLTTAVFRLMLGGEKWEVVGVYPVITGRLFSIRIRR